MALDKSREEQMYDAVIRTSERVEYINDQITLFCRKIEDLQGRVTALESWKIAHEAVVEHQMKIDNRFLMVLGVAGAFSGGVAALIVWILGGFL